MEGDNKYDPIRALYTKRVRQLKDKNNNLRINKKDLMQMTATLQKSFYSIGTAAKTLKELDKKRRRKFYFSEEKNDENP